MSTPDPLQADPHYWDHKVYTSQELYDALRERDALRLEVARLKKGRKVSAKLADKNHRLAKQLRSERKAAGVTMRQAAAWMKISKSYLGDLEKGKKQWSEQLVKEFRRALKRGH